MSVAMPVFHDVKGQEVRFDREDVHIVRLTKSLTDYLLSLNTHNRPVKEKIVLKYASEIKKGEWRRTNQGVGVDVNYVLTDGQHRLLAVKSAGYPPVAIELSTGLEKDVQAVVDTHAKRAQIDILKLVLDRSVHSSMIAAVNALYSMDGEHGFTRGRTNPPSYHELADFLTEHNDLVNGVVLVGKTVAPAPVNAALLAFGLRGYEIEAAEIAEKISVGLFSSGTCPIYKLHKRILEMKGKGSGNDRLALFKYTANACITYARGESLQLLKEAQNWDRLPRRSPVRYV